ncbi:MAG TPA: sulfur carrier protein ThiS [Salinivirgaceae bacterium]|nr:sulfur carrier protein ThiS [Salinivirgaceae bacterium]
MKITLNNTPEELEGNELTVQQLLDLKKYSFKMIIVKINGQVVRRPDFDKTLIRDGDDVVIFHLVSGG